MNDTDTIVEPDVISEPSLAERRKGLYYLLGGLALMLIPIVFGIVLANTGNDPDQDSSGMSDDGGVAVTETTVVASRANLAVGATVVEVSSEFNENFIGTNAIDGSLATEWSSRGDGDDAYIVFDLGSAHDITGIGFRSREMTDGTSITNGFTITIDDGLPMGPFAAGVGFIEVQFAPITGQVVRIDLVETTGGNTGAVEIEIYGSSTVRSTYSSCLPMG